MRYTGPKTRLCRREGVNLFGSEKYQKILNRNQNIPGMHGGKRMRKISEYAKQLREKQKAKRIFGLSEKQFKKYFRKSERSSGITGDNLLQMLERRVDSILYRAGFAITRAQGRQFISHGLFLLNDRKIDIPSILLRPGDKLEIKNSKKSSPIFQKNLEENADFSPPSWLKIDKKKMTIEILELPDKKHFEQFIEPQMIVEFYSR